MNIMNVFDIQDLVLFFIDIEQHYATLLIHPAKLYNFYIVTMTVKSEHLVTYLSLDWWPEK